MKQATNRKLIGIDPGTNTGFAIKDAGKITYVAALKIHEAMELAKQNTDAVFYVEDARKRKWFGNTGREVLQGAGSVKRDCAIWSDFLVDLGVEFRMVAPKDNKTKLGASTFKQQTGYQGRTNKHGRDAAMIVWGLW